jgi:hypothetical protein
MSPTECRSLGGGALVVPAPWRPLSCVLGALDGRPPLPGLTANGSVAEVCRSILEKTGAVRKETN